MKILPFYVDNTEELVNKLIELGFKDQRQSEYCDKNYIYISLRLHSFCFCALNMPNNSFFKRSYIPDFNIEDLKILTIKYKLNK